MGEAAREVALDCSRLPCTRVPPQEEESREVGSRCAVVPES